MDKVCSLSSFDLTFIKLYIHILAHFFFIPRKGQKLGGMLLRTPKNFKKEKLISSGILFFKTCFSFFFFFAANSQSTNVKQNNSANMHLLCTKSGIKNLCRLPASIWPNKSLFQRQIECCLQQVLPLLLYSLKQVMFLLSTCTASQHPTKNILVFGLKASC